MIPETSARLIFHDSTKRTSYNRIYVKSPQTIELMNLSGIAPCDYPYWLLEFKQDGFHWEKDICSLGPNM